LKTGGSFAISTFTAVKKTTEAAIDKEVLDKLHQKGLDEKSLTSAKNYVKDSFHVMKQRTAIQSIVTNVLV
jgi:hypothetical protein